MNEVDSKKDVAIRPAATVLLVDDRPELQVFMMQRNTNVQFAGGMWVFPGGSVDDSDNASGFGQYCTHRSDAEASAELGVDRGGLAYYVAAIREAFEEAGILLALHRENEVALELMAEDDKAKFDSYRNDVNDSRVDFLAVIEKENLILDAGQIHYVARWITPPGPPRRFDTRFFVSRMPANQDPVHDDNELVRSFWISPAEVIERVGRKEMGMLPPTLRMVESLAAFDSADAVIEAAAAGLPDERMPMAGRNGNPGERAMSRAEPGWMRLRPLS